MDPSFKACWIHKTVMVNRSYGEFCLLQGRSLSCPTRCSCRTKGSGCSSHCLQSHQACPPMRIDRNSLGLTIFGEDGKCLRFPVTRKDPSSLSVTSRNGASLGSGSSEASILSGSTSMPCSFMALRTGAMSASPSLNLARCRTSSYSSKISRL